MSAALSKIACAISNAKKFHKAAALLRQLLRDGQVTEQHGRPLFEVPGRNCPVEAGAAANPPVRLVTEFPRLPCGFRSLAIASSQAIPTALCPLGPGHQHIVYVALQALKASMLRPEQACQPDSAKEYSLLFTAASKQAQVRRSICLFYMALLPGHADLHHTPCLSQKLTVDFCRDTCTNMHSS